MIKIPVIKKFSEWFEEAKNCEKIVDHTEFCLATATKEGIPSARILLLKKFDDRGFCFFTNYNGRKSIELDENPNAAICLYWNVLGKQIRIEGEVEKLSTTESDEYFETRPRGSKLGAWASKQSTTLQARDEFEGRLQEFTEKFAGDEVTRPENWGGWRLIPKKIEFWQAEEFRYHHRELWEKQENGNWGKRLLYP